MGLDELYIYDDDLVSEENIATQFLAYSSIGALKVLDVRDSVLWFSDETEVFVNAFRVTRDTELPKSELIVSAVDSINARKEIWQAVQGKFDWYLDARMAAEEFQLYTVRASDTGWYQEFIDAVNEGDIPELPCTEKATIYTAAMAAGWIGAAVKSYRTDGKFPKILIHNIKTRKILEV